MNDQNDQNNQPKQMQPLANLKTKLQAAGVRALLTSTRERFIIAAERYTDLSDPQQHYNEAQPALQLAALEFAYLERAAGASFEEREFPAFTLCARRMADCLERGLVAEARNWELRLQIAALNRAVAYSEQLEQRQLQQQQQRMALHPSEN